MISFFGTLIRIFLHAFRSKRIILSENALLKLVSVRTGGVEAPNMDCITTITDRRRKGWNKSPLRHRERRMATSVLSSEYSAILLNT
jgi:hypothetical protein